MTRALATPFLALFLATSLHAQEPAPGPPGAEFIRRVEQWMTSPEASKRQAAYRSWMQLGPEAIASYEKSLRAAEKHHSKALDQLARGRTSIANPYAVHHDAARQLDEERTRVIELIRTDFKKDDTKVKMLRSEVEALEKLWTRVNRFAAAETVKFDAAVESATDALVEIARELERFPDATDTAGIEDDEELRESLMTNHLEASYILEQRARFQKTRDEVDHHAKANSLNAGLGNWASSSMKDFTALLNKERVICGLSPFVLEEKLSDACRGHSEDMARLGFFAHESPVEGKKTPWDRAKLAGFQGGGAGENIFMGSTSHTSAYGGWFGSDGHRFIMFSQGPNVVGVGIAGSHWTMMTGNYNGNFPELTSNESPAR